MHRCLSTIEVQRLVFLEVRWQPKGLATLARLARTCHIFNGVALNILWEELDAFVFLVQCLPRDLWNIKAGSVIFRRPMSLSDWQIFSKYSSRVRIIRQDHKSKYITQRSGLSDDVIFTLSNPPTHGPLVPHLKTLCWSGLGKKDASLLRLLLAPSLTSLSLPACELRSPEISILTSIGTMCPSLKCLAITSSGCFADARDKTILSNLISSLPSELELLTCPSFDEAAVVQIRRFPLLVGLSLVLHADFDELPPHALPLSFACLRTLKLRADTLPTLTSLLKHMKMGPESVSFIVAVSPTPDTLRLFFLALANMCGLGKLSHISLTITTGRRHASYKVDLSAFQPLLPLSSIHSFEFDVTCDLILDDDAIATLANHWPKLTSLSLNESSGWRITPRVTHKGLITLLSRCSALSYLAITVDFSSVDVPPEQIPNVRPGGGVTNCTCTDINFGTSVIEYPYTIAAFLSDICPELQAVELPRAFDPFVGGPNEDDLQEKWKIVNRLLPVLTAVRRQCMDWIERRMKRESTE